MTDTAPDVVGLPDPPVKILGAYGNDTSRLTLPADANEVCPLCHHGRPHTIRRHNEETDNGLADLEHWNQAS